MTEPVDLLYQYYSGYTKKSSLDTRCVAHDLALYDIELGLSRIDFFKHLKTAFNTHLFIIRLKETIKNSSRQSLSYGGVVRWIQDNTTTVPTPRSWEIKQDVIVNILYSWICDFDDDFEWVIPGSRSQVIYYEKKTLK
jgi:hypothetical protein